MPDIPADLVALKQRFEGLPPRLKSHAKAGFGFISEIDESLFTKLLDYIIDCIANGIELDDVKGCEITGLSNRRIQNMFTASTIVGFAVLDFNLEPEEVSLAIPESIIEDIDRPSAEKVAAIFLNKKDDLKEGLEKKRLASSVLPVFHRLNIEVDLRFEFDEDENVRRAVPIAIAHFQTDNSNDELFIQFDVDSIDVVVKKLSKVRERMLKIDRVRIEHG